MRQVEHTACTEQYKIVLGKAGTLFEAQNEMKFRFKCKKKVKQSLYTPWRRLGGEEV
jgi:hypothetical protein